MKKPLIAVIIFLVSAAAVCAKDLPLEDLLSKMEDADKTVNSLEFTFKQDIAYNLTNEKQSNEGKVFFLRPDNILIRQRSPLEQEITANGKKVWIYTPKYGQVIVDSWKKWTSNSYVPASIINFGKGYKELKKRYVISYEGRENGRHMLMFTPAGKETYKMKFWIDEINFIPVMVVIYGDNVTIKTEMLNSVLNPKLDRKIFVFQPRQALMS